MENMKAVDDESEDKPDLMEISFSEFADGGSAISETKSASESSVCITKATAFLFVSSFTSSSYECLGSSDLLADTSCCMKKFTGSTICEESVPIKKARVLLIGLLFFGRKGCSCFYSLSSQFPSDPHQALLSLFLLYVFFWRKIVLSTVCSSIYAKSVMLQLFRNTIVNKIIIVR